MGLIYADTLRSWFEDHSVYDEFSVGYIMGLIDEQPIVDAEPVRHGRWWRVPLEIANSTHHYVFMSYRCSECKHAFDQKTPYCPWCGAKMDIKRKKE